MTIGTKHTHCLLYQMTLKLGLLLNRDKFLVCMVISRSDTPRSYVVQTVTGNLRRNRQHLTVVPDGNHQSQEISSAPTVTNTSTSKSPIPPRSPIQTWSRTSAQTRLPTRFRKGDVGARDNT